MQLHATECFGEDDIVVEGAVDDVNTVQVIEGPRGRVLVADQATDFFSADRRWRTTPALVVPVAAVTRKRTSFSCSWIDVIETRLV